MVRLKVTDASNNVVKLVLFQFQHGTIKSLQYLQL